MLPLAMALFSVGSGSKNTAPKPELDLIARSKEQHGVLATLKWLTIPSNLRL